MSGPVAIASSAERSLQLLRARPLALLVLGIGVVLSLLSLCCGIGAVMAPWILCEMLAVQLEAALAEPIERDRSWFGAGVILLGAVLLVGSVGWLTWLGLGTDPVSLAGGVQLADRTSWVRLGSGGALLAIASAITSLVFVLPFFYAPLILLHARSSLGVAVLESARLVLSGGVLAHFRLSLVANLTQALPVMLAAAFATLVDGSDHTPLWMLLSIPLLSLSLPLGQGMSVAAYAARREALADVSRARHAGQPSWALVLLWTALVGAPVLSFGMLGASLVRPSHIPAGQVPAKAEIVAEQWPLRTGLIVHPEGTALELRVDRRSVQVVASDGGGAGALSLRSAAAIEGARVVRVRERYGIEVMQDGRHYATWIDRAGVRLDDDLQARLIDRVPDWVLFGMLATLLATAAALLPVLGMLGELRRLYTLPLDARPQPQELAERRKRTLRNAALAGAALLPLGAFSLYWGARSLLGG